VDLSEAHSGHPLVDVIGPPHVMKGDVQMSRVLGSIGVIVAYQIAKLVGSPPRIVEFRPRNGDEVTPVGYVEIAIISI